MNKVIETVMVLVVIVSAAVVVGFLMHWMANI